MRAEPCGLRPGAAPLPLSVLQARRPGRAGGDERPRQGLPVLRAVPRQVDGGYRSRSRAHAAVKPVAGGSPRPPRFGCLSRSRTMALGAGRGRPGRGLRAASRPSGFGPRPRPVSCFPSAAVPGHLWTVSLVTVFRGIYLPLGSFFLPPSPPTFYFEKF